MAPAVIQNGTEPHPNGNAPGLVGPHPSNIQVSAQYLFQLQIQGRFVAIGSNPTREDSFRLQGIQWLNEVRTVLQLPIRTFCTAASYYHKFRLIHKDTEYQFQDAAAAALLTACKIEDTLKKSKEILAAAHNIKVTPAEHLSSDDPIFEGPSKVVIGLERLMLEASGFDFRVRYPQKHLIKLAKAAGISQEVGLVAYNVMIDLYRTFAPLKQSCSTMSFACVELATIVSEKQQEAIRGARAPRYKKWGTTRAEIVETILDLLDLYTHFQKSSTVGPSHHIEKFIQVRIQINQELTAAGMSRYTEFLDSPKANGIKTNIMTPKTPITPASPSNPRTNGKDAESPATLSPRSSSSAGRRGRAQEGTTRFMLDAEQAKREKDITAEYYKVEYEDYEVEVEEPIKNHREEKSTHPSPYSANGPYQQRNGMGRDDRFNNNKRPRY